MLRRRNSIEDDLDVSSFGSKRHLPESSVRRSERNKRRKSVDKGDTLYTTEEDEEEFIPKTTQRSERKPRKGKKKPKFECAGKDKCLLCQNGSPYYLHKSMNPGWRETLLAVFEYFPKRVTVRQWKQEQKGAVEDPEEMEPVDGELEWLYLPDSYGFLEYHWDILCPPQHRNRNCSNWRKTLQDTLSHNRTYFISGKEIFGRTGFWRLYERAPSPSHHYNEERARLFSREPSAALFNTPITVDSFFRTPEPQPVTRSAPSSLMASSNLMNDNNGEEPSSDFSELQLLLEAIDSVQQI